MILNGPLQSFYGSVILAMLFAWLKLNTAEHTLYIYQHNNFSKVHAYFSRVKTVECLARDITYLQLTISTYEYI